jgi:hypothetical protein
MHRKLFIGLLLSLVVIFPLMFTGCKTTGGGSFYDYYGYSGDYYTFGLQAQPVGEPYSGPWPQNSDNNSGVFNYVKLQDAKGQITLQNHTQKFKIKGSFKGAMVLDPEIEIPPEAEMPSGASIFTGTYTGSIPGVEGTGPFTMLAMFTDSSSGYFSDDMIQVAFYNGPWYNQDENDNFTMAEPIFGCGGYLEPGSDIVVH